MKKLYLALFAMLLALSSWAQNASVQIIHNSPTPGTDAGPVVDIYVNGALLPELTGVPFRAATPFLDVPASADIEVAIAVNPSTSVDDAIATFPLGNWQMAKLYGNCQWYSRGYGYAIQFGSERWRASGC
jgi:hypothetical protein